MANTSRPSNALPQLLTRREAAKLARVSTLTLDRARKAGLLRFHRVGSRVLISTEQLAEFLRRTERATFHIVQNVGDGEDDQR